MLLSFENYHQITEKDDWLYLQLQVPWIIAKNLEWIMLDSAYLYIYYYCGNVESLEWFVGNFAKKNCWRWFPQQMFGFNIFLCRWNSGDGVPYFVMVQ